MGICLISSIVALNSYIAAGWGVLDSAYMVIITLFGIGYGEVHPISDPILKIQTITLIIVGCLSGLYSVGGLSNHSMWMLMRGMKRGFPSRSALQHGPLWGM